MERKRRSGSVPQLGRVALKRVAVPIGSTGAPAAAPVPPSSPPTHPSPDDRPTLIDIETTNPETPDAREAALLEAVLESGFMQQVEVEQRRTSRRPEPEPPPPPVLRRVLVVEADGPVREAVLRCLPDEVFRTEGFAEPEAALEAFNDGGAALCIIGRELRGGSGAVLCKLIRRAEGGSAVGIVLMSPNYTDATLGARESSAYGADAFLPLPASAALLANRIEWALSMREPIERLGVLPPRIARAIDERFAVVDRLDYYALLGLDRRADTDRIRKKWHGIAQWLHPDRHARLRKPHPHVYERINALYKRMGEAYAVLVDDDRRRRYNLGLHKRGTLRLDEGRPDRESRELGLCATDDARSHVLESLEARSLGDLEWAEQAMARAVEIEPQNRELGLILSSIRKLLDIVRRGR